MTTSRRAHRSSFVLALCALVAVPLTAAADPIARTARVDSALQLLDLWIAEQVTAREIPGLAIGIVQPEGTLWAKGYGRADLASGTAVTPATTFRLGSVSKVFTATAILQLRDAGKLDLDDPVVRHLPWFRIASPYAGAPPITVRHLLTHTSGLPREGAFPYWTTHTFPTREELRAAVTVQSVFSPPGASYRYSNLGVALLGEIVEAVSGEPFGAYLARHVFAPLGMAASTAAPTPTQIDALARAYERRRPGEPRRLMAYYDTGIFAPMGGVISSLEDMAKFALLQLQADAGGSATPQPGAVLAPPTLAEMQRLHFVYPSFSGGRGLGFAVTRRDNRTTVGHGGWIGGHRADLVLDPARRLAVVVLTNADDAAPGAFARRALDLIGTALEAPTPAPAEKVADPAWSRYLGTYTDPWGWEIEVTILDGTLVLYEHDYPPADDPAESINKLTPVAGEPDTFTMSDGERVRFELAPDGTVRRLLRRYNYLTPIR